MAHKTRIMYIEPKGDSVLGGDGRIGRVTYSKSGRSLYYQGREFIAIKGGFKANFLEAATHEEYWISGCKVKGGDRLYSGIVKIDSDVREEYWTKIRKIPANKAVQRFHCAGKYSR